MLIIYITTHKNQVEVWSLPSFLNLSCTKGQRNKNTACSNILYLIIATKENIRWHIAESQVLYCTKTWNLHTQVKREKAVDQILLEINNKANFYNA